MVKVTGQARHFVVSLAVGVGLTIAPCASLAQAPGLPPRDAPRPQTGTSAIKGRLIDAATGAAIPRARVRLQGRLNEPPITITDANGMFAFANLPAGSFTLFADKTGYMPARYPEAGQSLRSSMTANMTLGEGERLDRVTVPLSRGSAIAGRVIDSYGDPVENVDVRVLRLPKSGRTAAAMGRGRTSTNDLGEVRVARLEPGDYILFATPRNFRADDSGDVQPVPTYYPGVLSVDQAQPVPVNRGDSTTGLVLTLVEGMSTLITGKVIDAAGQPATPSASINVRSAGKGNTGGSFVAGASVRLDGTFRFRLPAGEYELEARAGRQGVSGAYQPGDEQIGLLRVTVGGSSMSDLAIVLREPADVSGRFLFDGTQPLPANPQMFRVNFYGDQGSGCRSSGRSEVAPNLTFVVNGVSGTCRATVSGGDWHWTVKAVMFGGVDLMDRPIAIEPGQHLREVQVVFTDRRTELGLQVADDSGQPTREYVAMVFAVDRTRWVEGSRQVRSYVPPAPPGPTAVIPSTAPGLAAGTSSTGSTRRDSVNGLPAGDYYVIAIDDALVDEVRDPGFLERLAPQAIRVTLVDGSPVQVNLRRIRLRPSSAR